jgi:hydrogenase maturation protease
MEKHTITVIGLGTILYSDQGLGLQVIQALQKQKLPKQVELIEAGMSGFNLIPWMDDRKKVIFISAIAAGKAPGTIHRFSPTDLESLIQSKPEPISHLGRAGECEDSQARDDLIPADDERSLLDAIQTAEYLGITPEIVIIGMEPESIQPGLKLTGIIAKKIPVIVSKVKEEIQKT